MDLGQPNEAATGFRRALDVYEDLQETEHERYANTTIGYGAALGLLTDFEQVADTEFTLGCLLQLLGRYGTYDLRYGYPIVGQKSEGFGISSGGSWLLFRGRRVSHPHRSLCGDHATSISA